MWKYYGKISQLGFFILYIIFYSFISFSSTHVSSIPLLLFIFLLQNLPATSNLLFSVPPKKKFCSSHQRKERDRDRERRERLWEIGLGLHHMHLHRRSSISTARLGQIGLFFFFFSYLLVLIQIYFKNWILFCGLCLD